MAKTYNGFELNYSEEDLEERIKKKTSTIKLLKEDAPEYQNLADGDKEALRHLVKAAYILNDVYLKQDYENNIALKEVLEKESQNGDKHAQNALKLFNSLNGCMGVDRNSEMTYIFKGMKELAGKNFYPKDITKEELQNILKDLIKAGKKEEAQAILSQRTIVKRDNNGNLYAVDYIEAFQDEFAKAADELEKAAQTSTNSDFNQYLTAQAKAFRTADNELDCEADRIWATLQDTPLEFTVSREQYEDALGGSLLDDEELATMIQDNEIDAQTKDAIGIRVGIVNKEGTKELLDFKKYLPALAELMPLKEQYTQTISADSDVKQTMIDADIVCLKGDQGAYRGGITIAENLPNGDKLSVRRGNGRRNVYHRQIRLGGNPEKRQKRLDASLNKELHKYFDKNADHRFTIGHENAHSLGPTENKAKLGYWSDIIEENKADMGSVASLKYLQKVGKYNDFEVKQILVTWAEDCLLKAKPQLTQAHRVRSVMQLYYFIEKGAISINNNGILNVNFEKMIPTAQQMLKEIIELQLSQSPKLAEEFVTKYFQWTDNIEKCASNLREIDKDLYGQLDQSFADKLAIED